MCAHEQQLEPLVGELDVCFPPLLEAACELDGR
jgi:hypothetical protein